MFGRFRRMRRWRVLATTAVAALLGLGAWAFLAEPAPSQPIDFPHRAHLELKDPKMECTSCHEGAEKRWAAGRPSTKKCLSCHEKDKKPTPAVLKLVELGKGGGEVSWERVWRLPSRVAFSHRQHVVLAKVECKTCHGAIASLDAPPTRVLTPTRDRRNQITMRWCMDCHAKEKVSNDCNACHR